MNNQLRFNIDIKRDLVPKNNLIFENLDSLSIVLSKESKEISLLQLEWNILPLLEWFVENQEFIQNELLLIDGICPVFPLESLAQCLNRLQEKDFSEEDEKNEEQWFDTIFNFRQRHALRFGLRGAKVPDIIIGLNHGMGEISLSEKNSEWSYSFGMDDFMLDLQEKIKTICA